MATAPTLNIEPTEAARLRLECVRVAQTLNSEAAGIVADAAKLAAFVLDGIAAAPAEQGIG